MKNETASAAIADAAADAANAADAARRKWAAPVIQRMATSAAELGSGDTVDAEGMS